MKVELLDKMGTDLSVVNAARVSYAKVKDKFEATDERLIKYLAEHNHWSPFAHTFLSFRIEAPIFVARQLVKHQIGLVWNEESRRYIDDTPKIHKIKQWREKPKNSKQGSGGQIVIDDKLFNEIQSHMSNSVYLYNKLIQANIAPEQARAVLPLNTYTNWIWSGTLYAFARVCKLRLDDHAQKETRDIAQAIHTCCYDCFPISWKYLLGEYNEES
jgi:thymidylate synthase (FAD)